MERHFKDQRYDLKKLPVPEFSRRTTTAWLDFQKLVADSEHFQLLIQAMQIINDIQSAQFLNARCRDSEEVPPECAVMISRWGMRMTAITTAVAIEVIGSIEIDPYFRPVMALPLVAAAYDGVKLYLKGGSRYSRQRELIKRLRDKTGAHFDGLLVKEAIHVIAGIPRAQSKLEFSNIQHHSRYYAADAVINAIVVGPVWGTGHKQPKQRASIEQSIADSHELQVSVGRFLEAFVNGCLGYFRLCD